MTGKFYNEDAPMPFEGLKEEEEPAFPGRKKRSLFIAGGMLGPMGYLGQVYPFMMDSVVDDEAYEDPNP